MLAHANDPDVALLNSPMWSRGITRPAGTLGHQGEVVAPSRTGAGPGAAGIGHDRRRWVAPGAIAGARPRRAGFRDRATPDATVRAVPARLLLLCLPFQEFAANDRGPVPSRQRRRSAASPWRMGSRGRSRRCGSWRSIGAVSRSRWSSRETAPLAQSSGLRRGGDTGPFGSGKRRLYAAGLTRKRLLGSPRCLLAARARSEPIVS